MRVWVLLLGVLLAGCAGAPPTDPPGPPGLPRGEYVASGLPAPYGTDDVVHATVDDGVVTVRGTCNTMSGDVSVDADGVVTVESVGGTELGCPGRGFAQDEWLVGFLTAGPVLETQDGGFSLTAEDTTLRFLPPDASLAVADVRLLGTRWRLTGIEERNGDAVGVTTVPRWAGAWLRIADGAVRFETGCNSGGGRVSVEEGRVRFRQVAIELRGCRVGRARLERGQVDVLMRGSATWSVDGDRLRLGRGPTTLLYTAR